MFSHLLATCLNNTIYNCCKTPASCCVFSRAFLLHRSFAQNEISLHRSFSLNFDETPLLCLISSRLQELLQKYRNLVNRTKNNNDYYTYNNFMYSVVTLAISCGTCIFPITPVESIREARFTVLPQISNTGFRAPITPPTNGPQLMPTLKSKLLNECMFTSSRRSRIATA